MGRFSVRPFVRPTENLSILQDFVPYRAAALPPSMKTKEKVEQGEGTADHLMPLGYLFCLCEGS